MLFHELNIMYQAAAVPRTSGTQHGEWERRRGEPRSGGGSCPPWRWCRPPGGHPQRHPAMGLALSVACLPTTAAATAATAAVTTRGGGVAAADTAAVGRTRAPAGPLQLWRRRRGSRSTRPLFLLVMTPPLARRHQPHRCRRRCGPRFAWGSPRLAAAGSSPLARGGGGVENCRPTLHWASTESAYHGYDGAVCFCLFLVPRPG